MQISTVTDNQIRSIMNVTIKLIFVITQENHQLHGKQHLYQILEIYRNSISIKQQKGNSV